MTSTEPNIIRAANIEREEARAKKAIAALDRYLGVETITAARNKALVACYAVVLACAESPEVAKAYSDRRIKYRFSPKLRELFNGHERARSDLTKFAAVIEVGYDQRKSEREFAAWIKSAEGGLEGIYKQHRDSQKDPRLKLERETVTRDTALTYLERFEPTLLPICDEFSGCDDGDRLVVVRVAEGRASLLRVLDEIEPKQVYQIIVGVL